MFFGWTIMRWQQADGHEARHQRIMDEMAHHRARLDDSEAAIRTAIIVLSEDLAKISDLQIKANKILSK